MTSLTHKYIPNIERKEKNLFMEEYYSSTDTEIYINDESQTEISYISYSLNEQLKPIYGYASSTFDDVSVGSRIVTGIFKTPIVNTENQSSYDEIKNTFQELNALEKELGIYDYNNKQEENKNSTEWIGDTGKLKSPNDNNYKGNKDENYEYKNKLNILGYNVTSNSSDNELIKAIKDFQRDNNIQESGELNYSTKLAINEAISYKTDSNTLILPAGTVIFAGPTGYSPTLYDKGIKNETKAFVKTVITNSSGNKWIYITTEDGIEGYIDASSNTIFQDYINGV